MDQNNYRQANQSGDSVEKLPNSPNKKTIHKKKKKSKKSKGEQSPVKQANEVPDEDIFNYISAILQSNSKNQVAPEKKVSDLNVWKKFNTAVDSTRVSEVKRKKDKERYYKDTERSTWWMADEEKNARMRRWLSNLEFKEEMKKNNK